MTERGDNRFCMEYKNNRKSGKTGNKRSMGKKEMGKWRKQVKYGTKGGYKKTGIQGIL